MLKHFNIKVTGKVQMVFFRASAKKEADHLNIKGFARNEDDGSVYIEAEGEEKNLKKFLEWCHEGSPEAVVENVDVKPGDLKNVKTFSTS